MWKSKYTGTAQNCSGRAGARMSSQTQQVIKATNRTVCIKEQCVQAPFPAASAASVCALSECRQGCLPEHGLRRHRPGRVSHSEP